MTYKEGDQVWARYDNRIYAATVIGFTEHDYEVVVRRPGGEEITLHRESIRPLKTTYEYMTVGGDVLATIDTFETDQDAIEEAKTRLRDDPELGEVHVYQNTCFIGRATHVPDSDWQSVVAWLWDGEQVLPPAGSEPSPRARAEIRIDEMYSLTDPKHPRHHDVMSGLSDDA